MKACELCGGACCESLVLPVRDDLAGQWFRARGIEIEPGLVEVEQRCKFLQDGRCVIYRERPYACAGYEAGGENCRATVKRRRRNWREIFAQMDAPGHL